VFFFFLDLFRRVCLFSLSSQWLGGVAIDFADAAAGRDMYSAVFTKLWF
jgi:hypothetical protein